MSDIVLKVENVSKRFRIGTQEPYHRLSEVFSNLGRAAVSLLRDRRPSSDARRTSVASPSEFWALKNVSFEVKEGEVVGIVGRNGAGKSTLLKILARITEPTSGDVSVRGRISSLLEVGTGFHPELTGRENIFLNGAILGMSRAEVQRRFDDIVDFSEIGKFLDTPVKRYSSGMHIRLGFAVAAHLEPEILVVDEVLAVGDASFQKKCMGKMGDAARSGRTVLFVSHNMTAVRALCSQALWIDNGMLTAIGETASVADRYLAQTSEQVLERSWGSPDLAPGSAAVRLKRIAVLADGPEQRDLKLSHPMRLEMDFWTLIEGLTLNPSVVIQTLDGIPVFNTAPTTDCAIMGKPFQQGLFRSVCHIPPNLLNDETYRVQLYMIRDHHACEWRLDDLLTFELRDDTLRNEWFGKWIGTVRPTLHWETIRLREEQLADSDNFGIQDPVSC